MDILVPVAVVVWLATSARNSPITISYWPILCQPDDRANLPLRLTDLTSFGDVKVTIAECKPQMIVALGALLYSRDELRPREMAAAEGRPLPVACNMKVNIMGLYY